MYSYVKSYHVSGIPGWIVFLVSLIMFDLCSLQSKIMACIVEGVYLEMT